MQKPKALKPGDTVRLVSPASSLIESKLTNMIQLLESEGYKCEVAEHALDQWGYLAGTDAHRAADFQSAFEDDKVDAVLCTRGGYGCNRILPMLDLDRIAACGKQLIGYSDVTAIQLALLRRGTACVYAPMAITFVPEREPWVYQSFKQAIRGENPIPEGAPKGTCLVPGEAEGILVGGCLCLLTDSLGTADALDTTGRILFIEDVDENPHRVDAMLTHLLNIGLLAKCKGIVIAEMTGTDERSDPTIGSMLWRDIVRDRVAHLGIPTIIDFPAGHMKQMHTLPLGLQVRLRADQGSLEYLETL